MRCDLGDIETAPALEALGFPVPQFPSERTKLQLSGVMGVPGQHPVTLATPGPAPGSLGSDGASEQAALVQAALTPRGERGTRAAVCAPGTAWPTALTRIPDTFRAGMCREGCWLL